MTQAELKSLANEGSNGECSEDETLVDDSEAMPPSRTERIIESNAARHQSVQINGPVEKDLWESLSRLVVKENVSEDQSLQVNYATPGKVFMTLLNRQDEIIKGANQKIESMPASRCQGQV